MSHQHKHCAHGHLEFCTTCQVVYCHDCNQEWTPKQTWWGTTYTYGNAVGNQLGYKTMTNAESPVPLNPHPHTHGG